MAWLSNLFAPTPQAQTAQTVSSADAAEAIEAIVNAGGQSRGMFGQLASTPAATASTAQTSEQSDDSQDESRDDERHHKDRKGKGRNRKNDRRSRKSDRSDSKSERKSDKSSSKSEDRSQQDARKDQKNDLPKREPNSRRDSRGAVERGEARPFDKESSDSGQASNQTSKDKQTAKTKSEHKSSNPDEVNLRVNQAPSPLKEQDVVHLSLDDSKPVKQKPSERTEQAERASDTVTKESSTSSQTKKTHDAVAQNSDDVATSNERISGKSLDFTEQDVFADRYVTAQKYGQASNDPRVVRAKHQVEQSKGQSSEQPASKTQEPTLIVGTVGEFIVSVFDDGASRIENDGVIASFLQALATVGQTSKEATANDVQTNTASSADDVEQFSFVNYGYEPLSASELTQFAVMTAPVAMTQAEQGKTEVMPRPIGKRASNDPRGQHPDFVDNDVDNKANQADKNEVNVDATTSANPSVESSEEQASSANPLSPLEVMQELLSLTTGQLVERVLGDVGKDLIAVGKPSWHFYKRSISRLMYSCPSLSKPKPL